MTRRKKLLIILGAGSSVSCGLPSVPQLDGMMKRWAAKQGLYDGTRLQADFFGLSWRAIERHIAGEWARNQDEKPNFEKALGLMIALSNWVRPRPHGQVLRDLVDSEKALPAFFDECRLSDNSIKGFGASCLVTTSYVQLLMLLAAYVRDRSRAVKSDYASEFATYDSILRSLRDRFDVGILSLNYDDVPLQAWPDAFCGFADGTDDDGCRVFDPVAIHARKGFGFIYHLHGSVHHTLPDWGSSRGVFDNQIRWRDDLSGSFVDGVPHGGSIMNERSDGNDIAACTLIAGALKLDQLLGDPFQTIFAALQRHVHEADAILIAGYGFGDMHVNRMLLSRMTRANGSHPPVMILDWASDDRPTMFSRYDGWPHRMRMALAKGAQSFDVIPGYVGGVKRKRWFETAGDQLAVWQNGFLESMERLVEIENFLDGDVAALNGFRSRRRA